MPYKFENPDLKTFKALKFNGQLFAVGRGLFIHLQKYFPQTLAETVSNSRSKVEFSLDGFAKATRAYKINYKGLRFEYVDVSKEHRPTIKACSKFGEGWWPERSRLRPALTDQAPTISDFLMNYENGTTYMRRLGKGHNMNHEERLNLQDGVEFTRKGYKEAIKAYQKLTGGNQQFSIMMPMDRYGYLHLKKLSAKNPIPEIQPVSWLVWRIKNKTDREEFIKNANR